MTKNQTNKQTQISEGEKRKQLNNFKLIQCPVCLGRGYLSELGMLGAVCHKCNGKGVVAINV